MLDTLQRMLAWGIIFAVAVMYFKPIVMCLFLMRKNNAGLATSKELSEIEDLLRQHPWKEEQELQMNDAGTEAPYLQLKGFYTVLFVRIKDGVLTCSSGPITSLRKSYWELYEANQLLQYISLLSTSKDIAEVIKLQEQTQIMLSNKKGRDNAKKWLKRIFYLAMLLALFGMLNYAKNKNNMPSALAQNMVFDDFHYTKTVGSALNSFDPDGEWFDVSDKDALKNVGVAYAGWRGTCHSASLLGTDEDWPLTIYFELTLLDDGNKYSASIDQIEFGQYRLSSSYLLQSSAIWDIMNMIYGNQNSVSVSADTGLFNVTYFLSKKGSNTASSFDREEAPIVATPTPEPEPADNGVKEPAWEYEDYVEYYGFDPADYGYYWYNEIRNGPLDEFFEYITELLSETNATRLYADAWLTDLTWDDFVGTWQTESGINFTIDCLGDDGIIEDYTIDLSGNGLGILGGWFSENIYNIEGEFCGMSGNNGVTSFSVTYQYGTDSPETNTWLFLELVDSEGNTVRDTVPLVRDGIPCL